MGTHTLICERFELPPDLERQWLGALPEARRCVLLGGTDTAARHRSLIANRLLGQGLTVLGSEPAALRTLRYAPSGKPSLDPPLAVSITYGEDLIACAVSDNGPVGLDIERIGRIQALAFRRYLHADERRWAGEDPQRFYHLWTRKEALAKAAGDTGLALLPQMNLPPAATDAVFAGARWRFWDLPLGPSHCGHLVTTARTKPAILTRLDRRALERDECRSGSITFL